jgi:hypothetical protein
MPPALAAAVLLFGKGVSVQRRRDEGPCKAGDTAGKDRGWFVSDTHKGHQTSQQGSVCRVVVVKVTNLMDA